MDDPTLVVDRQCETAEGPLWHPGHGLLYWVDIPTGTVFSFDPVRRQYTQVYRDPDRPIGGITLERDGRLLLFQSAGVVRVLDPRAGKTEQMHCASPENYTARFNDVTADPQGRVYAGVMPDSSRDIPGKLVRIDRDGTVTHIDDCRQPNGMAFSPDHTAFYFTDTGDVAAGEPGSIIQYDYDEATGVLSNPTTLVATDALTGYPDGLAVDTQGHLWSAFWDGHALRRFSPSGELVAEVKFPPGKVSSVAFGTTAYDRAFVTTACPTSRRREGPGAGGLYMLDIDARGRPPYRSALMCS
jgi:D-xylonolactonase